MPKVITGTVIAKSACSLLARITDMAGNLLTPGNVSSIAYSVFSLSGTPSLVASGSLTVSEAVFSTLQVPTFWTVDDEGYNFQGIIPDTALASNVPYRIEIKFTLTSSQVIRVPFEVNTVPIYGS